VKVYEGYGSLPIHMTMDMINLSPLPKCPKAVRLAVTL